MVEKKLEQQFAKKKVFLLNRYFNFFIFTIIIFMLCLLVITHVLASRAENLF